MKKRLAIQLIALAAVIVLLTACNLSTTVPITPATALPEQPGQAAQVIITATPNPTLTPLPTSTPTTVPEVASLPETDGKSGVISQPIYGPPVYQPPIYTVTHHLPGPACSVTPTGHIAVNIRNGPGTGFAVIGSLPLGRWVVVNFRDVNGWYRISMPGTPVDGAWIFSGVVHLQQPCTCGYNSQCIPNVYKPPVVHPPIYYPPYHPPVHPVPPVHPPVVVPTSTTIPIYVPPPPTP